jgi:A/G-specific adenine glycosylase
MINKVTQSEENIPQPLAPERIEWFHQRLSIWGKLNLRKFPWRQTSEPYAILVAEFLLQKTNAATVFSIYKTFLSRYPTLKYLAAATVEDVTELLQPLGLYFRAGRLIQLAKILLDEYEGKVPNSEQKLLKLPGIGKYTARSICSHAFGQPSAVLDTNVARILERFFGLRGGRVKSRCKILWDAAEKIAPVREVSKWNLTLLDFGAMVCTAKNPLCKDCLLSIKCNYAQTHIQLK